MTLILSGTNGLSDVDGSAATPAIRGTDTNTGMFFPAADTVGIATGGTERARVDSSGNLGLGVTPSAWSSAWKALQINTTSSLVATSSGCFLNNNNYFNGTSNLYLTTDFATRYLQTSGEHRFYNAPSGTAGNAITFTQAMTLDASGNLGVGQTSPTAKLDVVSTNATTAVFRDASRYALVSIQAGGTNQSAYLDMAPTGTGAAIFQVSSTERARIDTNGNLLVSSSGNKDITVKSTSDNATLAAYAANAAGKNAALYLECPGAFGVGFNTDRASTQLRVWCSNSSSGVNLTNGATSWGSYSDERLKDIIEPIENAAQKVSTLRAVIGKYKADANGKRRPFLIAQDVRAVLPEAVYQNSDEDDTLNLAYTDTIPLLVAAIQEQQAIITQLQADIETLKQKVV